MKGFLVVRRLIIATVILALSGVNGHSQTVSNPSKLYRDIAHSIQVAQGTSFLSVTPGIWKTVLPNHDPLIIRFDDNTRIEADFDYEAGVLQSATLIFQPAIHVWVKDPRFGFSASLDKISYDNLGDPTAHLTLDHNGTANPNLIQTLNRQLRMSRTPDGIFLGQPFPAVLAMQLCTDVNATSCSAARPYISEVRFETIDSSHPSLRVLLKDGASIHLSSKNTSGTTFDNSFVSKAGSGFTFQQIDYSTNDQTLFAVLDNFDLNIQNGLISTKDMNLVLGDGSRLQFSNLTLHKNGASALIDGKDGQLSATVSTGSTINFSTNNANGSTISLLNGSQVNLMGFAVGIDDQRKTDILISGGSTVAVQIGAGRLGFGLTGFLSLNSGTLNAQLDGDWDSSAHDGPQSDLKITFLEAKADGGILDLNSASHLKIDSGNIKATDLLLRSFEFAGITGTISTLNLVLKEDTTLGIPSGIQMVTGPGATLVAATPQDPIVFKTGNSYPTGMVALNIPFKEFANSTNRSMVLKNGTAHLNFANRPDGTISGEKGSIDGTGVMVAADVTLTTHFRITDLSIFKEVGKNPIIHGNFTGKIDGNVAINYTSAPVYHTDGHDNLRIYPITVSASIPNEVAIPQSAITFDNLGFSFTSLTGGTIEIPLSMRLTVPPGRGEHQQPDDQDSTADGTHGPDEDQHRQEVVTDTFPACRLHIYAIADTYNASASLSMKADNSKLSITLSNFRTDRQIGYSKDGCDVQEMLAIALSVAGTVFAGPVGGSIGAVVGYVAGGDLDNVVSARVNSAIVEKLQGIQVSWHFQL